VFLRELEKAEELELSEKALDRVYQEQDKKRSAHLQRSLDQQVPVMQELERLTGVYKKWYPKTHLYIRIF